MKLCWTFTRVGLEDNDVDALRHAFISGVYTIEYNEGLAELLGRLNEFTTFDSQSTSALSENMDLWNNTVGIFYGEKTKTWNDLYLKLMKALKANELIIDLKDTRKYKARKVSSECLSLLSSRSKTTKLELIPNFWTSERKLSCLKPISSRP